MSVSPAKRRRPLKYYNILLHRYLGYFFAGTTVIYAVSGFAVNHIEDWNPNYTIEHTKIKIAPFASDENISENEAKALFQQLNIEKPFDPENVFYPEEGLIEILVTAQDKITLRTAQTPWSVDLAKTRRRPVLHLFNFLHLNSSKKLWTLYADVYAIALLLLALTGLWMKKGKKGLLREAGLWAAAGMLAPFIFIWMYYIGS